MITVAILAVICGAEGWEHIETFGKAREAWLRTVLTLPKGVPSDDTFRRVFTTLRSDEFRRCFTAWMQALVGTTEGKLVAIDGKTLRRSFDRAAGRSALHLVHAWVEANSILLGQYATEAKSNEITAIPALLALLDVRGAVVTIDAMGCQKAIAAQIVAQEADYILALKDNHPTAHAQVVAYFEQAIGTPAIACSETTDGGHGRIEVRRVYTTTEIEWFEKRTEWEGLGCCIRVDCERTVGNKTTSESRYFLSSLKGPDPVQVGAYVRGHWSVENPLHWSLDVSFHEDASRIRKDHGPENFALLRRIALVLLKNEHTAKGGVPAKRLRAGWDPDYLLKVLATGISRNALEKG